MKIDPKALFAPLLAVFILFLVLRQTMDALKTSGSWQTKSRTPQVKVEDPYARLDRILTATRTVATDPVRDPFGYGGGPVTPIVRNPSNGTVETTTPAVTPLARPILTSIIWDADPRATIRYSDKDFSVRENTLFADFRVKSITSAEVVLERNNGEQIVLALRPKGE